MTKKYLAVIAICITAVFFGGCTSLNGSNKTDSSLQTVENNTDNEKINIICTNFPEYDWVKQIIGENNENVDLTLLIDSGVDVHSYQPTIEDITKISNADLFIYVGGESDAWIKDALNAADNKKIKVLNLMEILSDKVKEEDIVEGMQEENESHSDSEEDIEYDEHIWLSLKNAIIVCQSITESVKSLDSENAEIYEKNYKDYSEKLTNLDKEYENAVLTSARKTVLFADRFPFRYLVDDYGLDYYAAFPGCSSETEASFKTIAFLSGKTDELELPTVFVIEKSNRKIADTIIKNTQLRNQKVLVLNSMQSVTKEDIEKGENYLSIMNSNLSVLKEALN